MFLICGTFHAFFSLVVVLNFSIAIFLSLPMDKICSQCVSSQVECFYGAQ